MGFQVDGGLGPEDEFAFPRSNVRGFSSASPSTAGNSRDSTTDVLTMDLEPSNESAKRTAADQFAFVKSWNLNIIRDEAAVLTAAVVCFCRWLITAVPVARRL